MGNSQHCFDKIHHHNQPFVTLNGRLYAVSNVRRHDSPGSYYPTPAEDLNTTLLRRILQPAKLTPGGCDSRDPRIGSPACPNTSMRWSRPSFGPIYWATDVVPYGYKNITRAFGIRPSTMESLSPEERMDLVLFRDSTKAKLYTPDGCR